MQVRGTYEEMNIAPDYWQVSAPGAGRTDIEPDVQKASAMWSGVLGGGYDGFDRRVGSKAAY